GRVSSDGSAQELTSCYTTQRGAALQNASGKLYPKRGRSARSERDKGRPRSAPAAQERQPGGQQDGLETRGAAASSTSSPTAGLDRRKGGVDDEGPARRVA